MLQRWKQSGWAFLRRERKDEARPKKWVGTTFKIGDDFFGIPLQAPMDVAPKSPDLSRSVHSISQVPPSISKAASTQTYHTAQDGPSEPHSPTPSSLELNNRGSNANGSDVALIPSPGPSSHRKAVTLPGLLSPPSLPTKASTDTQVLARSTLAGRDNSGAIASNGGPSSTHTPKPLRSALHRLREDGGSKSVQFSPVPQYQVEAAPPSEVLARRSSGDPDTSAGAAAPHLHEQDSQGDSFKYGDVIRRGKSLRRCNVKSGNVGLYFNAEDAVKLRDFRSYEWKEFLVVWRKRQLELYEDYSIPGKEMLLGHKHLACVIPLQKPETHVSLYSFIDLTFCLTCTMLHVPKDKTRTASSLNARFHHSTGTDVFIFKTKARSSGIDWMWELWRQLGNDIPRTFEVHCPALATRVRLQVPEYNTTYGEGYKTFTKDYVVDQCRKSLEGLPSWDYFMEEPVRQGAQLELCWRKDSTLDWIRWEADINGMKRSWAVLYGLCLGRPRETTHLEIRASEHRSTMITLSDGSHLREPPAVEGYLYRIKPNSQNRQQVYLSTHAGCLFSINHSRAHPPHPPIPLTTDTQFNEDVNENNRLPLEDREINRGTQQVLQASAFVDLRSIVAIRRAFQPVAPSYHENQDENSARLLSANAVGHEDEEDAGGDEELTGHPDKSALRMRRSFELLMRTGHVVRFETHSCTVAQEWVEHLGRLIEYWTSRHRVDATQEMELIHATTGNPGLTIRRRPLEQGMPEQPPDYDQYSQSLPSIWNWCVVDGCMSVVRNGRLFVRRGLRGQYRLMQLVLVPGHLIQFHIGSHQTSHHLRSRTTSLLDAYVCSGHYATQSLPIEEFSLTQPPLPRRFQDGLENEDHELDTVFLIWYRPHAMGATNSQAYVPIPPLKAKHRVLVLKARSKLERDEWCWALNADIERLLRSSSKREANAQDGGLAKL
ncbi:hypothetical protein K439DRAFT_1369937 [Ramaria rubella]|nr:hypothetical protein K439DRAFT_1369937 [Ramaria rubella]